MGALWSYFTSPSYYVNSRRFKIVNLMNVGGFSFVYLVKFETNFYVLKRIPMNLTEYEAIAKREIQYMKTLSHPSLIKLIEYEISTTELNQEAYVVMAFYKNGSIDKAAGTLREKAILRAIYNVAEAVKYLNELSEPLAHRDIKPENMLVSESNRIVLTDLGSISPANIKVESRQHALELQELFQLNCTSFYRAPELFDIHSQSQITKTSDIWSIGCTIYFLAYKTYLFDGTALSSISCNISYPSIPRYENVNRIIEMCLKVDPVQRCNVDQLLSTLQPLI